MQVESNATQNPITPPAAWALLEDIIKYIDAGHLTPGGGMVFYCDKCDCMVEGSVMYPEAVHRCGTVLEIALCACGCDLPATYLCIEDLNPGPGQEVRPFRSGHDRRGCMARLSVEARAILGVLREASE